MRLTLRTMLAYLDGVLEPADAEVIGKKIRDSEFASGLVHRIRNCMRKLRLGAPRLEGKGMGLDPNTVAEYLDSTLSPDRVADFEKICLESDVHLAEVAACHQILTLVLGEPAEVPPSLRQRIYQIGAMGSGERPKEPLTSAAGATSTATTESRESQADLEPARREPAAAEQREQAAAAQRAPAAERQPTPERTEIPDYLRASTRRSIVPYVATAVLVFLIASVAILAIGVDNLRALFTGQQVAQRQPQPVAPTAPPAAVEAVPSAPPDTPAAPTTPPPAGVPAAPAGLPSTEPAPPTTPPAAAPAPEAPIPTPVPEPTGPLEAPAEAAAETGAPSVEPTPPAQPSATPTAPSPMPPTRIPLEPAEGTADGTPAAPGPAAAMMDVGRYTSDDQLVARFDRETNDWYPLQVGASVSVGDVLVALPTYRPQITFASGLQLTIVGPSRVELGESNVPGMPKLIVPYGRLRLLTVGHPGLRVPMQLGGRDGMLTFIDADGSAAIEVRWYLPPGSDPASSDRRLIVQVIAMSGSLQWEDETGATPLKESQAVVLLDKDPVRAGKLEEFPEWVASSGPSGVEEIASRTLGSLVDRKRSLVLTLEERVGDDRVEVRSLASRCLSYLDLHDSLLKILGSEENRTFWEASVDAAQEALARSPESAAAVKAALQKHRGTVGDLLYRLLWGYSEKQLREEGADVELVDFLDHDSLDVRVLAFINLRRITGQTFLYRPEAPARRRVQYVDRWRSFARDGKIRYKEPPTLPLPKLMETKLAEPAPVPLPPAAAPAPAGVPAAGPAAAPTAPAPAAPPSAATPATPGPTAGSAPSPPPVTPP